MHTYKKQKDESLYTVGYFDPQGKCNAMSDHESEEEAAWRVSWLNGGERQLTTEDYAADALQETNRLVAKLSQDVSAMKNHLRTVANLVSTLAAHLAT